MEWQHLWMNCLQKSEKIRKINYSREIIVAGDDITFVCNAKLAIPAVKYFLEHIGDEKDYTVHAVALHILTAIFHFLMHIR